MFNLTGIKFGGKTDRAQIPAELINRLTFTFMPKVELFKETFNEAEVCFYGEGYGAKIQGGGGNYIKDGVSFCLFDVKIGNIWLERKNVEDIAKTFNLKVAPIIGEGTIDDMISLTKKGFNSQWGDFIAEGIVARLKVELKDRRGNRIITKSKHKDWE